VHEAKLHARSCFITLTFNDQHLPPHGLDHEIWQLFYKRLKSFVRRRDGKVAARAIRFFMCGEYGDQYGRAHFHAIIFGYDFSDKKLWSTRNGVPLFISAELAKLWTDPVSKMSLGFSTVGEATLQSAGYIARYVFKRVTGDAAEEHYRGRRPEYNRMSLKPGLGFCWFQKFGLSDVAPHDNIIHKGKRYSVPRYYDKLLESMDHSWYDENKFKRFLSAMKCVDDNTPERLLVKEAVHSAKLKTLYRGLDNVT
jgi:predicted GNAT superfamily acetyltransferase